MSGNRGRRPPLVAEKRYSERNGSKRGPSKPERGKRRAKAAPKRQPRGPLGALAALVRGTLRFILKVIWGVGWRATLAIAVVIGLGVVYFASTLPAYTELVDGRTRGSVTLSDRDGEVFAWRGENYGGMVTADDVAPVLRDAVVATEDRRFFWHPGVDPQGIAGAIRINLREGRGPLSGNGGSTITQQTAKLLCLGVPYDEDTWESKSAYEDDCRRTTLWRKVKEAVYAMAMEASYTKEQILSIYLNRVYLGAGSHGVEAASQRYFGHSASEVSPAEAAMLAGLLKAPSANAPTNSLTRAQDRADVVVGLMENQGYLTADEADYARANPARLSQAADRKSGGYFADWVMDSGPEFFTRDTTEDVEIRTTLDQRIQSAAEQALVEIFNTRVSEGSEAQAAIVVMSADGAVRAMVGGRDISASGAFNRATQALRQTGSAFKPFVYAAALDLGMDPRDVVVDEPFCMNVTGSGRWCPTNYTNDYVGPVTLTQALTASLNIPTVKISEQVGRENVRTVAAQFGIDHDIDNGPALALGTSESTLLEMTGAYAGILNGGSAVEPYGLTELRLQGENEALMGATGGFRERVIMDKSAKQLVWMMNHVVTEGTGNRANLEGWEVAGKTGTTQGARDAWFIGFTADYVAGVWMGYDDNTPLTGVTGGGLPAEIWHETMRRVTDGMQPKPLPMMPPQGQGGNNAIASSVDAEEQRQAEDTLKKVIEGILAQQQ